MFEKLLKMIEMEERDPERRLLVCLILEKLNVKFDKDIFKKSTNFKAQPDLSDETNKRLAELMMGTTIDEKNKHSAIDKLKAKLTKLKPSIPSLPTTKLKMPKQGNQSVVSISKQEFTVKR